MAEKWIIEYSYGHMTPTHDWSPWAPIFEGVYKSWTATGEDTPMKPRSLKVVLSKMAHVMQRASVQNAAGRLRYRARKVGSDETIPCEIFI